jgi:tellurite resistance protein TehA-like permease
MDVQPPASLKERLCEIQWGWYSISMATGGIAVLLNKTPHQFTGLPLIGKIIYIFNLLLFLAVTFSLIIRFLTKPKSLKESFQQPSETYFAPTSLLSIATIILGAECYGSSSSGPWLQTALRIVFWIYVAISVLVAIAHNWYLYYRGMATRQPFPIVRLLPFFPAMLSGTIASTLASNQPSDQAVPILIGGLMLQGFGFLMSLLVYAEYHYYLNKHGLPDSSERPEMFIAVGPWSFTALALIGMAKNAVEKFPSTYIVSSADSELTGVVTAGQIALVLASLVAVFLWTMAFFHFCIALISVLASCRLLGGSGNVMSLPYWSMVFPNTGFVIATISIGQVLKSEAILWLSSIMTVLQVTIWLAVGVATIHAVSKRRMLWPMPSYDDDGKDS